MLCPVVIKSRTKRNIQIMLYGVNEKNVVNGFVVDENIVVPASFFSDVSSSVPALTSKFVPKRKRSPPLGGAEAFDDVGAFFSVVVVVMISSAVTPRISLKM